MNKPKPNYRQRMMIIHLIILKVLKDIKLIKMVKLGMLKTKEY